MNKQIVLVGDVHGCIDEFTELLRKIEYDPDLIRLILLGDLTDRGPDTVGVVRKVREMGVEVIYSNHEDKHVRWRMHAQKERKTGKPNPMNALNDRALSAHEQLTDDDIEWMKNLPLAINFSENWWAIHGGCETKKTFAEQDKGTLIRCRFVADGTGDKEKGSAVALTKDKKQPPNSVYWAEVWPGPESFVYGHCVHSLTDIRMDEPAPGVKCVGIDTGCAFGGRLTALFFPQMETVQVKALDVYKQLTLNDE